MTDETRDSERQKTYNAEDIVCTISSRGGNVELHGTRVVWPTERKFGHLEHIEAYIDQVMRLPWFKQHFPVAASRGVTVRKRQGRKAAHYEIGDTIAIPDDGTRSGSWAMRELVVLHELSHHVAKYDGAGYGSNHDAEFRGIYVTIVGAVIGPEAGWVLQTCFYDAGLRITLPTKNF